MVDRGRFNPEEYWNERLRKLYSLRGTGTAAFSERYNALLYRLKERCLESLLKDLQIELSKARVFNFGCGTGYFDEWFERRYGCRIVGVDISEYTVQLLQHEYPRRIYIAGNIVSLSHDALTPSSYDLVTAIDVLYHIVEETTFVKTVERVCNLLRPGGSLIFTDRVWSSIQSEARHVVWHTFPTYERLLRSCGLEIEKTRPMHWQFERAGARLLGLGVIGEKTAFYFDWLFAGMRRWRESMVMCRARKLQGVSG